MLDKGSKWSVETNLSRCSSAYLLSIFDVVLWSFHGIYSSQTQTCRPGRLAHFHWPSLWMSLCVCRIFSPAMSRWSVKGSPSVHAGPGSRHLLNGCNGCNATWEGKKNICMSDDLLPAGGSICKPILVWTRWPWIRLYAHALINVGLNLGHIQTNQGSLHHTHVPVGC